MIYELGRDQDKTKALRRLYAMQAALIRSQSLHDAETVRGFINLFEKMRKEHVLR